MTTADPEVQGRRLKHALAALGGYGLGVLSLLAAYALTFLYIGDAPDRAFMNAWGSVGPAAILGLLVCYLAWRLGSAPFPLQAIVHVLGAVAFSWAWYGLMRASFALLGWLKGDGFELSGFYSAALRWQLCQGLLLYSLLVAVTIAYRAATRPLPQSLERAQTPGPAEVMRRFLTRQGEIIGPVDVGDIILINGADDYSEVVTPRARHLVRMTLGEFERRLDPEQFLRVHRSKIINFDRLVSAEPAGAGKLLLHLEGGETARVSRSGAQKLRDRIV